MNASRAFPRFLTFIIRVGFEELARAHGEIRLVSLVESQQLRWTHVGDHHGTQQVGDRERIRRVVDPRMDLEFARLGRPIRKRYKVTRYTGAHHCDLLRDGAVVPVENEVAGKEHLVREFIALRRISLLQRERERAESAFTLNPRSLHHDAGQRYDYVSIPFAAISSASRPSPAPGTNTRCVFLHGTYGGYPQCCMVRPF